MKKLILLIITLAACVLLSFPAAAAEPNEDETCPAGSIVINPKDLWQVVVAVGAGIVTLAGAGGVITGAIHKAKSPNQKQNERLDALEKDVEKINERLEEGCQRFDSDRDKLNALEMSVRNSNQVIVESLQALISHAIDGNNTDSLKSAKDTLNEYLRSKI